MTSRLKKIGFTTAAGLGLFAGAAGIAAAASSTDKPAPAPAAVVEAADEARRPATPVSTAKMASTQPPARSATAAQQQRWPTKPPKLPMLKKMRRRGEAL